jgi:hypothetical protein
VEVWRQRVKRYEGNVAHRQIVGISLNRVMPYSRRCPKQTSPKVISIFTFGLVCFVIFRLRKNDWYFLFFFEMNRALPYSEGCRPFGAIALCLSAYVPRCLNTYVPPCLLTQLHQLHALQHRNHLVDIVL